MKHSESIKEIAGALLKAQIAIKAALKDSTNPHFKSKYADLSSVIDAVKGPLNANGIVFTQGVSAAENGVAVETMLIHTSGEWMSETLPIPVSRVDAQGVGSAITYGRRYGLQSMCGVPAEDDDGNAASKAPPPEKKGHSASDGALDALPPEDRADARKLASSVVDLFAADKEFAAYELVYQHGHSNEFILAVWECLRPHSAIRRALKKMHEDNQLATQA